jgi:hypothetical protein
MQPSRLNRGFGSRNRVEQFESPKGWTSMQAVRQANMTVVTPTRATMDCQQAIGQPFDQ